MLAGPFRGSVRSPSMSSAALMEELNDVVVAQFSSAGPVALEDTGNGTWLWKDVKIFRTGDFVDSRGRPAAYDREDLEKIAAHFALLRRSHFPNVPVRIDHGRSARDIVGYFADVRVAGNFLVGDIEITEPDAKSKVERGTFRSRSSEVGVYTTNEGEGFFPALMGMAFVDIPAVEGLFSRQLTPNPQEHDPVTAKPEPQMFTIKGVETSDPAQVMSYIAELEARPEPHTFKLAGEDTQDFAAVQAHVDTLEAALDGITKAGKESFVDDLAASGKIVAAQTEGLKAFALSLSDEQYDAFRTQWDAAPALPQLGAHGAPGNGGTPTEAGGELDAKSQKIEDLRGVVAHFRRANVADEKIQATDAYQQLMKLTDGQG